MNFTTTELIEISLINRLPKKQQISMLQGLLSQCDRICASNPLYSRKELEKLPPPMAIYIARNLTENE